ncbi:MAG: DUF4340 domain-containing protein [Thermodesulfobacteriota bacterium]|nr:DUF4340 domain-containing protein [Thermodesulfobacteriota bacterium]
MKFKATWIIALLFLGSVFYLLIVEIPGQREKRIVKERENSIFSLNFSDLNSISIQNPDIKKKIELKKDKDKNWNIVSPVKDKGNDEEIRNLLATLENLRYKRIVEEDAEDLDSYGIKKDGLRVIISDSKGKKQGILIGNDAPFGEALYIKKTMELNVYLVDKSIKSAIDKTVYDLRNKNILAFSEDKLKEMNFTFPSEHIVLKKVGDNWKLTDPVQYDSDDEVLSEIFNSLRDLKIKEFVEEKGGNFGRFGLDVPSFTIKLMYLPPLLSEELCFGNKDEQKEGYYARKKGEKKIVLISSDFYKKVAKRPVDLRDHLILRFDRDKVEKIALLSKDKEIVCEKKKNLWEIKKPKDLKADEFEISNFLYRLSTVRVKRFLKDGKLRESGLDNPGLKISLWREGDKNPVCLELGRKDKTEEEILAKNSIHSTIFAIEEKIAKDINKTLFDLRDKSLFGLDDDISLDKIEILFPDDKSLVLVQKKKEWGVLFPKFCSLDKERLNTFIWDIRNWKFKKIFELNKLNHDILGFNSPNYQVKIWKKDDKKPIKVTVGKESNPKENLFYSQSEYVDGIIEVEAGFLKEMQKEVE